MKGIVKALTQLAVLVALMGNNNALNAATSRSGPPEWPGPTKIGEFLLDMDGLGGGAI